MAADMFATLERTTQLVDEGNPDEAYRVMKDAVADDSHGFARIFLAEWIKHLERGEESVRNKFGEILIYLKEDFPEVVTPESSEEEFVVKVPASSSVMPVWLAPLDPAKVKAKSSIQAVPQQPEPPNESEIEMVSASPFSTEPEDEPVSTVRYPHLVEQLVENRAEVVDKPVGIEPTVDSLVDNPEPAVAVEPVQQPEHEDESEPPVPAPTPTPAPTPQPPAVEVAVEEEVEHMTLTFYEWQMAAIQKAASKEGTDENSLLTRMLKTRKMDPLMWSRYKQGKTTSPAQRITITVPHKTKARIEKEKDFEGIKTTTKYVRKILFGARAEKA